jgi:thiamine pyrophosphokinase
MNKCIIFGGAAFEKLIFPLDDTDYVIAADSGLAHLEKLGRKPDAIVGDFDSLGFIPNSAQVFPVEKDDTDMLLAIRHGLDKGYREFVLYGGLDGNRLDHTIANLQTLAFLLEQGAHGYLVGKDYTATVIQGETAVFSPDATGILSVFCMGAAATGVTLHGLQYSLENGRLTADFPLGVSNHFLGKESRISVQEGKLLLLWDTTNGFPEIL